MVPPPGPIYLITGLPGAGKTTVARALCERSTRSIHIPGDDLRDLVVSGFASGLDAWTDEHGRQFDLSWRCAALIAAAYSDAGFTAVIDDVVREQDLQRVFRRHLGDRKVATVLLDPPLEVALAWNQQRTNKSFDPERLDPIIRRLHGTLSADSDGWLVVDPSTLSTGEIVDRIVRDAIPRSLSHPTPHTLIVINGPIASGKNTVSTALAGILEREGRRVAAIDLDDLWVMLDHQVPRTHELDDWLEARRAAALLTDEFYRSGRDTVIVNGPFFTAEERTAYIAHVTTPVAPLFVTLRVSLEEAWRRAQRDPRRVASKDREWLTARHAASDALMRSLAATDLVLPTEGRTPADIASDVLERVRSPRAIGRAADLP